MTSEEAPATSKEVITVRWGGLKSQVSLYGSALTQKATGEIQLTNRLMPSGTTIQEWYSFTDYQSVRDTPDLPLLHNGAKYRVEPAIESDPPDSVMFEVRYFDRFNAMLRAGMLYPPDYSFDYPSDCHHYTIRLVNAGCDQLSFTSFTLLEVTDHGEEQ